VEATGARHVYHIYALRVSGRDRFMASLSQRGISCGIHYPIPVHLQDAYRRLELKRGSFPIAERCAEEFVSLPMYPELSEEQLNVVHREILSLSQEAKV
jgi:dTDP-4-amino-4,6-dideoxygalactose transaminase